jgi:hypothetical protein
LYESCAFVVVLHGIVRVVFFWPIVQYFLIVRWKRTKPTTIRFYTTTVPLANFVWKIAWRVIFLVCRSAFPHGTCSMVLRPLRPRKSGTWVILHVALSGSFWDAGTFFLGELLPHWQKKKLLTDELGRRFFLFFDDSFFPVNTLAGYKIWYKVTRLQKHSITSCTLLNHPNHPPILYWIEIQIKFDQNSARIHRFQHTLYHSTLENHIKNSPFLTICQYHSHAILYYYNSNKTNLWNTSALVVYTFTQYLWGDIRTITFRFYSGIWVIYKHVKSVIFDFVVF